MATFSLATFSLATFSMATFSSATFSEVVLLATLLSSSAHSFSYLKAEVRFGLTGEEATFPILPDLYVTPARVEAFLYRLTLTGSVLLKNSSDPSRSSGTERSERVGCFYTSSDGAHAFILRNLSLADRGQYMTETWTDGTRRDWTLYNLTVCAGRLPAGKEELDGAIEWTLSDVRAGQGGRLQIYSQNLFKPSCPPKNGVNTLILDTQRSNESLVSDLNVTVRSLGNGSWVRVGNAWRSGGRVCSHILRWSGDQCHLHSERACSFLFGRTPAQLHFLRAGERFALTCRARVSGRPARWSAETRHFPSSPAPLNATGPRANATSEELQQDESGVAVSNASLVVVAAGAGDAGRFCCAPEGLLRQGSAHRLFVCAQLSAQRRAFVWADRAELSCGAASEDFSVVQWFRRSGPEHEDLILEVDAASTGRIHDDLGGRVSFSRRSMIISGVGAGDAGLYRCRLWRGLNAVAASCAERTTELVSMEAYCAHAALVALGLLGMICALAATNLTLQTRQRSAAETE